MFMNAKGKPYFLSDLIHKKKTTDCIAMRFSKCTFYDSQAQRNAQCVHMRALLLSFPGDLALSFHDVLLAS